MSLASSRLLVLLALEVALAQHCVSWTTSPCRVLEVESAGLRRHAPALLAAALSANPQLEELRLAGPIGSAGATAVASALSKGGQKKLRLISLWRCDIGDAAAAEIAAALPGSGVESLYLQSDALGLQFAQAIAAALPRSGLLELNVWNNRLGDEGAAVLATALGMEKQKKAPLRSLNLSRNGLTDAGAATLARLARPTEIYLHSNDIGDEGAAAWASALLDKSEGGHIATLDLSGNARIGGEGLRALASAATGSGCEVLAN